MPRTQAPREERDREGQGAPESTGPVKSSHIIEEHIDVGVSREMAYEQWTHYEELSRYSKRESAEEKSQDRVGFASKIGPSSRHWETEIVEEVPGHRIVWRSLGGATTMGVVSFHELDDRLTRLMIEMEYHPTGAVETIGNVLRFQRRRVRKDLRLFKNFIELSGDGPEGTSATRKKPARRTSGQKAAGAARSAAKKAPGHKTQQATRSQTAEKSQHRRAG
jgi:uncharacterized membrane protein